MTTDNNKKNKIKHNNYERYDFGPITLEKAGRIIQLKSNMTPEEFKKYTKAIHEKRPELKKEINNKIKELSSICTNYNPFELLSSVSKKSCFTGSTDIEDYKKFILKKKEGYVEYAQSLILGQKRVNFNSLPSKEVFERFNNLIDEIFRDVSWYFATEGVTEETDRAKHNTRFSSIKSLLFVRGDSYKEHHTELILSLFSKQDIFLKKSIGFTISEIVSCINSIIEQIEDNINQPNCNENPFKIKISEKIPEKLLDLLSAKIGEDEEFISFEKSPGWPINYSLIQSRPLIKNDNNFYCFLPQFIFRNLKNIIENWIKEKDRSYYQDNYQKQRADYLEDKGLEYIGKMLPNSKIYSNLFYRTCENGKRINGETDGIILYDNNLFIVEAKAGLLSDSAKKGSLDRIERDTAELIDKAYGQARKTKKYIEDTECPQFTHKNGDIALTINDKKKYQNIYLINITLEKLSHLSTQLNSLKAFNLIQGKEWLWSVYLNDLKVISEMIEFPSSFLLFLQRRILANDYPQFQSADELDFLMYFFYEGLFFKNDVLSKLTSLTPTGYTEDIDRYYEHIAGRISYAKKPSLKISTPFRDMITTLEATGKEGFTHITTKLLSFATEGQDKIIEGITKVKALSKEDIIDHNFTITQNNIGITFFINSRNDSNYLEYMYNYCMFKKYQMRLDEWIFIIFNYDENKKESLVFNIFKERWAEDSRMERQLHEFKKLKLSSINKKVGRNEPCPCGSGIKYKKCCDKIIH